AYYLYFNYLTILRIGEVDPDITPTLLLCKAMKESSLNPGVMNFDGSSAVGVSQVTQPTLDTAFANGFRSIVKGFTNLTPKAFRDQLVHSILAQQDLGVVVMNYKIREQTHQIEPRLATAKLNPKNNNSDEIRRYRQSLILKSYFGWSNKAGKEEQRNDYADKIMNCTQCLENNSSGEDFINITEDCLALSNPK
ncbi:MAG: hypothetical protein KDD22_05540, partial [Bdellovibrionales bacterium]|nr:hypothetical protein [Bdellovibrionales bacterium]